MKKRVLSLVLALTIVFLLMPANVFAAETVVNFDQFKLALENPSVDVIVLGANIKIEKEKPIVISPYKTSLTVYGNGFQIIQDESTKCSYALQYDASKAYMQDMIFNDLYLSGYTRKGFLYAPNNPKNSNFTITFNKVVYDGPELAKAKYSNVVLNDCIVNMTPGYTDSAGYLVDATNITLSGNVIINKQVASSYRTLFYVYNKGSITVAKYANVSIQNITEEKCAKKAGFANFMSCQTKLIFDDYCYFDYTGVTAFAYGCEIGEVYVGKFAYVNIIVSGDIYSCNGLLGVKKSLIVDNAAKFYIIASTNTKAYPVIKFVNLSSMIYNSPREVLIYNASWKTNCNGLAAYVPCSFNVSYNGIKSVEYWVLSRSPYYNLQTPTYTFSNGAAGGAFDVSYGMNSPLFGSYSLKTMVSNNYTGSTPFTAASLKDVNVIRIMGGSSSN